MLVRLDFEFESMADKQISIPALTDSNFSYWSSMFETVLDLKGLSKWIDTEPVPDKQDQVVDSRHALSYLRAYVGEKYHESVKQFTTCRAAFQHLREEHLAMLAPLANDLQGKMFTTSQSAGQSVDDFIDSLQKMNASLGLLNRAVPESVVVTQILNQLRPNLRTAASYLAGISHTMSITAIRAALRGIEKMQEDREANHVALAAAASPAAPTAGSGRGRPGARDGHRRRQDNPCNYCGHHGHYKADCRLYRAATTPSEQPGTFAPGYPRTGGPERHGRAMVASHGAHPLRCLVSAPVGDGAASWVIDSGASAHMSPRRDLFSTYVLLSPQPLIQFGGGAPAPAIARGSICIPGPSGRVV